MHHTNVIPEEAYVLEDEFFHKNAFCINGVNVLDILWQKRIEESKFSVSAANLVCHLTLTKGSPHPTPFFPLEPGDQVMVIPSLSDEEAKQLFPGGVCTKELPSGKKYLRYTPQPQ